MLAKGTTVQATIEFLIHTAGPATVNEVLGALPENCRARLARVAARDEVPYQDLVALWEATDARIGGTAPDWMERQGAYAIEQMAPRHYAGLLRKRSPEEFLTQQVSLFQLYYRPGNMEVVNHGPNHAVVRLVGFNPNDRFFCRRFTGAWHATIAYTGGTNSRVRHVRCAIEGDAFCEWELHWTAPAPATRTSGPRRVLSTTSS